jgi:hypothetical protein
MMKQASRLHAKLFVQRLRNRTSYDLTSNEYQEKQVICQTDGRQGIGVVCSHVVTQPVDCGPAPEPHGRSALAWQRVPAHGVAGKVVSPGILTPIKAAEVSLTLISEPSALQRTYRAFTNDTGFFRIDSIPPGSYLMRVRRIGYRQARDTVRTTIDSGLAAAGVLTLDHAMLDDCGLMLQEVRVPWWKR